MSSNSCSEAVSGAAPKSAASSLRRKREGKLLGKQMIAGLTASQKYDKSLLLNEGGMGASCVSLHERSMNYFSDYELLRDDENTNSNLINESSMSMS